MRKKYFYAAAMAAMLASCSSDNLSLPQVAQQAEAPGVEGAVNFSAYTPRSTTRSGYAGVLTDAQLQKTKAEGGGFGVFGYYTDQQDYDLQISKPNFMYNQGVFYDGSKWGYTPIKYWPNEYGSDAESQDIDKVTFFAYAPYVDVNATTGKVTGSVESGITAVSRNTNTGDPIVWYKGSFKPSEAVDLCWGTVSSDAQDWKIIQDNGIQRMDVGFPWLNVQRPKEVDAANQKLKFEFKHALAQLNIQIDADADLTEHNEEAEIGDLDADNHPNTKVYVRSISISGLASKGSLNLNNIVANEPLWQSYYGSGSIYSETATIFDGRRDGKEGVSGAVAVNETLTGLNPAIISDDGNTTTGVTKELKNLFDAAALTDAIYTIPTGEPISVTITYDVETADPNLAGVLSDGVTRGSSIENKITKEVVFGEDEFLKAGKKYTLILHLGLNSVKFDAEVSGWEDQREAGETWLPSNVAKGVTILNNSDEPITSLAISGTTTIKSQVLPSDVTDKSCVWISSNPEILTVTTSGTSTTLTKVGEGRVKVTATNKITGKTAELDVLVTKKYTDAVVQTGVKYTTPAYNEVSTSTSDLARLVGTDGLLYNSVEEADQFNPLPAMNDGTTNYKTYGFVAANKIVMARRDYFERENGINTWAFTQTDAIAKSATPAENSNYAKVTIDGKSFKIMTKAQFNAILDAGAGTAAGFYQDGPVYMFDGIFGFGPYIWFSDLGDADDTDPDNPIQKGWYGRTSSQRANYSLGGDSWNAQYRQTWATDWRGVITW